MENTQEKPSLTFGVDHIGLTVSSPKETVDFFTSCLGWRLLGENATYPSASVSDGVVRLTLWQVADPSGYCGFDRRNNIGLHHLALRVSTLDDLHTLYKIVSAWPSVLVEFAPEISGKGPKIHCMIREPGGCRIEFTWDPRL